VTLGAAGRPATRPELAAAVLQWRVMSRLNLTLDPDTSAQLERHAKAHGTRRAAIAREILREGLARREELERRKRLASDYAAGRADARELLANFESAQLELLGDEDA